MNKKQQPFFNPELSGFCSQMAMILHSGISSLEGITIMLEDSTSEQEKEIVTDCIHKIQIDGNCRLFSFSERNRLISVLSRSYGTDR